MCDPWKYTQFSCSNSYLSFFITTRYIFFMNKPSSYPTKHVYLFFPPFLFFFFWIFYLFLLLLLHCTRTCTLNAWWKMCFKKHVFYEKYAYVVSCAILENTTNFLVQIPTCPFSLLLVIFSSWTSHPRILQNMSTFFFPPFLFFFFFFDFLLFSPPASPLFRTPLHYASARAALLLHALLFLRSLYYTPSRACASHVHCSFFIFCMTYHAMHVLRRYIHATKIHINFSYKHVPTFRLKEIFLYGKLLRVRTRRVCTRFLRLCSLIVWPCTGPVQFHFMLWNSHLCGPFTKHNFPTSSEGSRAKNPTF